MEWSEKKLIKKTKLQIMRDKKGLTVRELAEEAY